jgi:antitoxin CptB
MDPRFRGDDDLNDQAARSTQAAMTQSSLNSLDRGRIRWRCRRGMRELDMLLEGWFDRHFDREPQHQQAFLALLEREDPDIWAWLIGHAEPPAELADVIKRLQHHA